MKTSGTLFSNIGFLRLLTGSVIGATASRMIELLVLLLVLKTYGLACSQFSQLFLIGIAATVFLSPVLSGLFDRLDRRNILWSCCVFKAGLALLFIPAFKLFSESGNEGAYIYLLMLTLAMGLAEVAFVPVRGASVPDVASGASRPMAASLIAGTSWVAILLGSVLAVICAERFLVGVGVSFGMFALAAFVLLGLPNAAGYAPEALPEDGDVGGAGDVGADDVGDSEGGTPGASCVTNASPVPNSNGYFSDVVEGFRFCWSRRGVRPLFVLEAGFWTLMGSFFFLQHWYAEGFLKLQSNEALGYFAIAVGSLGSGLLLGSYWVGKLIPTVTPLATYLLGILFVGLGMWGVQGAGAAFDVESIWHVPGFLLMGLGSGLFLGRLDSDLLRLVGAPLRGRLFAIKRFFSAAALLIPLALFLYLIDEGLQASMVAYLPLAMLLAIIPAFFMAWYVDAGLFADLPVQVYMGRQEYLAFWLAKILWLSISKIYFRFEVVGREKIPAEGPFIFASNHGSFLDPPLMGIGVPTVVQFLMHRSYYHGSGHPFFRLMMTVPVDESNQTQALKHMLRSLRKGLSVGVFPEGTVSHDGKLQKPESGVMFLAKMSGAPVVPFAIQGNVEAFPRSAGFPRPTKIKIIVGDTIIVPKRAKREDLATLTDDLMLQFASILEMDPAPKCLDAVPTKSPVSLQEGMKEIDTAS